MEAGDTIAIIFGLKCLCRDRGYQPDKNMKVDLRTHSENLSKDEMDRIVEAATTCGISGTPGYKMLQDRMNRQDA